MPNNQEVRTPLEREGDSIQDIGMNDDRIRVYRVYSGHCTTILVVHRDRTTILAIGVNIVVPLMPHPMGMMSTIHIDQVLIDRVAATIVTVG